GIGAGAFAGVALYAGFVRIPARWFFSATSALILLLAAAMAGQMARFLVQAGLLPSLATPLWDSSALLPTQSPVGAVLHVLVGYEATPSGMQVTFYSAVLVAILLGMRWAQRLPVSPRPSS
ncbi:MAG TPA: iron permease, partial [Rhodocyclaceae bacterium]|nr:iron permease [Rhodocyclaceae bacterium]